MAYYLCLASIQKNNITNFRASGTLVFLCTLATIFPKFYLFYRFFNGCSARDWDRIRITWGNPQSGCSDICSNLKGPL